MICGINGGKSKKDEERAASGGQAEERYSSFFSDQGRSPKAANNYRFRNRLLTWFIHCWGIKLETRRGHDGAFERSFFQTNWLDTQSHDAKGISHEVLVDGADGFLKLLEQREPSVIMFFGSGLIEALNDPRIRDRVINILGKWSGKTDGCTVDRCIVDKFGRKTQIKFEMKTQKFGETYIIGLPHPQRWGLSDEYVEKLRPPDLETILKYSKPA
ncbi:MAG: hypothetical protein LBQ75_07750 [Zoogloeaceae bacterium]|jgi:hypothetical protein|nr:hypothetical protein [Zoogloeaceae bacterium]